MPIYVKILIGLFCPILFFTPWMYRSDYKETRK